MCKNINIVKSELSNARMKANQLREELQATPLWQEYQLALCKESQLERQLENLVHEREKAELQEEFECITGHDHKVYGHTFLVVHKDCPHIVSVDKDYSWEITCKGKTTLPRDPDRLILGCGGTEDEAWRDALKTWSNLSQSDIQEFLGKD